LPNPYAGIGARGNIPLRIDYALDGRSIDLIPNAFFFKKTVETGAAVVKRRLMLGAHVSSFC
jgi:hypothetical protein